MTDITTVVGSGADGNGNVAPLGDAGTALPQGGQAGAPSPVSLADDALVEFTVGGQKVSRPWAEVRAGQMLHSDYTKKTQEVATQRREVEAQMNAIREAQASIAAQREQMQGIVRDPNKLASLYLASVAQSQGNAASAAQPPQIDANQIQAQVLEKVQEQFANFQRSQVQAALETDLTNYTKGLLSDKPALSSLQGIEDLIYGQVVKMGPKSADEAKAMAKIVADNYQSSLSGFITTSQKQAAVSKGKAVNGIEPKGGNAQLPVRRQYGDIDDPKRLEDMQAFFDQMMAAD